MGGLIAAAGESNSIHRSDSGATLVELPGDDPAVTWVAAIQNGCISAT